MARALAQIERTRPGTAEITKQLRLGCASTDHLREATAPCEIYRADTREAPAPDSASGATKAAPATRLDLPERAPRAEAPARCARAGASGTSGCSPCPATGACKIIPFGNSITEGDNVTGGHRAPLVQRARRPVTTSPSSARPTTIRCRRSVSRVSTAPTRLGALLDSIYAQDPNVLIILAHTDGCDLVRSHRTL